MNHKQINDLYRQDDWGRCTSHKMGVVFEFQEDYSYGTEFGPLLTLPKGLRIIFKSKLLKGWLFRPKDPKDIVEYSRAMIFGRARLLKMKLKECSEFKENDPLEETAK